MVILRR